ncbi:MAG: hypothetical protein R3B52_02220 [Candidatus Paceibacterota bacterium]
MRTALAAFLVVLCSLWAAAAAVADPVTVRVKSNDGSYSYVTRDLPVSSCVLWTVDFRRDDGTVWGSESDSDKARVEKRAAASRAFVSLIDALAKSSSQEHYNNPSPMYCSVFSSDTKILGKLGGDGEGNFPFKVFSNARADVRSRIVNFSTGVRTYYEQFKSAPGRSFMEYGRALVDGMAKVQKIEQQMLSPSLSLPFELTSSNGFEPFFIGLDREGTARMRSWARSIQGEEAIIQKEIETVRWAMRENKKLAGLYSREHDVAVAKIERLRRRLRSERDPERIDALKQDLDLAIEKRDRALERRWEFEQIEDDDEEKLFDLRAREGKIPDRLSFVSSFARSCGFELDAETVFGSPDPGQEASGDSCPTCKGTGRIHPQRRSSSDDAPPGSSTASPALSESGETCPTCGGTGKR